MLPLVLPQSPHSLSLPSSGNEAKGQSPAFLCWHGCYLRGGMILCTHISTISEKMKDKLKGPCGTLKDMVDILFLMKVKHIPTCVICKSSVSVSCPQHAVLRPIRPPSRDALICYKPTVGQ